MRRPTERRSEIGLRQLPDAAQALLDRLNAPPRLVAHLLLVHDAAFQLITLIQSKWPDIHLDDDAILFGAAVHDIGKVQYPEELSYLGAEHEPTGEHLLIEAGIEARIARFARTHGSWSAETDTDLEDLIVALADTCWKGKRDDKLEEMIINELSVRVKDERWNVYLALDNIIENIAENANRRVAWQALFPIKDAGKP